MKTFIVSMGIIIMGIEALIFSWDYGQFTSLQTHLKALCESSAAYAALCFDDTELEINDDIFYTDSEIYERVNAFVSEAAGDMPQFSQGTVSIEEITADSSGDKVSVCLSFSSEKNFFRIPIKHENSIIHISCYEWIDISEKAALK